MSSDSMDQPRNPCEVGGELGVRGGWWSGSLCRGIVVSVRCGESSSSREVGCVELC